jgi:hypothetical protein
MCPLAVSLQLRRPPGEAVNQKRLFCLRLSLKINVDDDSELEAGFNGRLPGGSTGKASPGNYLMNIIWRDML